MSLTIGRLALGPPLQWYPQAGSPIAGVGSSIVPGSNTPLAYALTIGTLAPDALVGSAADSPASRIVLRNQLLSMLGNTPLKLQSYLYLLYGDDPAQSGWFVPDQGSLQDFSGSSGLATGFWQLQSNWDLAGRRRTNREGRSIWMKDLRTNLFWRDQLKWIYSADFSALPALQCSVFPNGAASVVNAVSGQMLSVVSLPAGRDGGTCSLFGAVSPNGLADLSAVSYERSEAQLNLSDVIVYDRAGNLGPFSSAAGVGTNLVPNPNIEYGVTGWTDSASGDTLSQDATTSEFGTSSLKIISTSSGAFRNGATIPGAQLPTLIAGHNYRFSFWSKNDSGSNDVYWQLFDAGSNALVNGPVISTANVWTRTSVAITAVTSGVMQYFRMITDTSSVTWHVDGIMLIDLTAAGLSGSADPTYFDGDIAGYAWSGTPGDSASVPATPAYDSTAGLLNPVSAYGWQEVYGPDYPWSWTNGTTPADTPTLENGLIRVRYDTGTGGAGSGAGQPGFRVDAWTGTTYSEQGKMNVERIGDSTGLCNTWISSSLVEWTPDRAVFLCVLANSADAYSRERVYVTVQRGELSVQFECYPALKAAGTNADAALVWTPALNSGTPDLNQSVLKIDSQGTGTPSTFPVTWTPGAAGTAAYAATAGTGSGTGNSGQFGSGATTLGNANFTTSENWASILRCPTTYNIPGPYQHTLVVVQAANAILQYKGTTGGSATAAYGTATNVYLASSQNAAGYMQVQVAFGATVAQQVLEAESMTLGSGSTITVDAAASGGDSVTATRTTDANAHVTQATWPNSFNATYRVIIRAKVSANSASFYAKTGATTGTTRTAISSTTYVEVDLGEIVANGSTLEIHAWMSGGAGTVSVDRIEATLVQDRARTGAIFSGARDQGQSALMDSQTRGCLVAR